MNSSRRYIVAGWIAVDARPQVLHLPYLNLNPPFLDGWERTGLPAITSPKYFAEGSTFASSSFSSSSSSLLSSPFTFFSTKSFKNSHPSIFNLDTCFNIFGAFKQRPSAITRHAPPLNLFVSTLGRSL